MYQIKNPKKKIWLIFTKFNQFLKIFSAVIVGLLPTNVFGKTMFNTNRK